MPAIGKNIIVLYLLHVIALHTKAQHNNVSLTPAIDTLYSNKNYMFKLENLIKDQAQVNISFDPGYFSNTYIKYTSPNYAQHIAVPYIRPLKDGNYDLDYDAFVMMDCGRIKGASEDNRDGGRFNVVLTTKKENVIDTICKKSYYVKFIYDSSLTTSPLNEYYCYTQHVPGYPTVSFAGTRLTYHPGGYDSYSKPEDTSNCSPIPADQIFSAFKKKEPIKILPSGSGFKIVYLSIGSVETKVEADVEKVLAKYYYYLGLSAKQKNFNPPFTSFTVHLYNAFTGEILVLPFYKIPIQW